MMRSGVVRLKCERTVIAGQCVCMPLQVSQCIAAIVERFGKVRLERERTIIASQSLFRPL